ncbi:MAG: polysaccharide deacetylase family protein [Candidatus Margulisbacteria bacterium]|nr:polysaccharide deacetylase family protein [Candidatus Margulisiibacteriota bacterium]
MKNLSRFFIFLLLFLNTSALAARLKIPILMYHHIRLPLSTDTLLYHDLSVSPELFLEHLTFLKEQYYEPVTFYDVYEHYKNNKPLPAKPIILTFDDGAANNWDAFLELKKFQMKAVFFIITSHIGDAKHLDDVQLKTMAESGMEIGSHSKTHRDLTTLSEMDSAEEIYRSKYLLEKITGKPVVSFCYPAGKYNKTIVGQLIDNNYFFARTTEPGVANFSGIRTKADFQLKIIRIHNYTKLKDVLKT